MSYYRKNRRYYKNSTNIVKMKFQSFMDISTDVDSMKIITISAGGENLLTRCPAMFSAYKYYKIGNISAKLVPASSLPVDPTGLAYGVDQKVDPRDQLSPGLMRITNGEDIFEDITGMSSDDQHALYNSMMLDPRWYKWMLQRGVKRHATPRYWQIGQLHQDKWPGAVTNTPFYSSTSDTTPTTCSQFGYSVSGVTGVSEVGIGDNSSMYGLFQTGHRGVLGWLPTDGLQTVAKADGSGLTTVPLIASPVEVEVMKCVLPKAYKTRYYYRLYISETVYFKEPLVAITNNAFRPLDVFHYQTMPFPALPSTSYSPIFPNDTDTGGNYGDD